MYNEQLNLQNQKESLKLNWRCLMSNVMSRFGMREGPHFVQVRENDR